MLKQVLDFKIESSGYECSYTDDFNKYYIHMDIFKCAIEYTLGTLLEVEIIKLLGHGNYYWNVYITVNNL